MKKAHLPLSRRFKIFTSVALVFLTPIISITNVSAIDSMFYSGNDILFYDPDASGPCSGDSGSTGGGSTVPSASNAEVRTFVNEPVTSTWNISDSKVEQWFLKQAGARSVVRKYGLTASNIGNITKAVKSNNVSPAYFYIYAATEGGGAAGFINHFSSDTSGGGEANAARDAKYINDQSKVMTGEPAWVDMGVSPRRDFVPQSVKASGNADYKNMKSGSIGRIYIAATAAAAWEVYYPEGLKKSHNQVQDYGGPISVLMDSIKRLGGNPMDGGSAVSSDTGGCDGNTGVTGEGMAKGLSWAKMIADNNGYGYDQPGRTTGWQKWQSDPKCTHNCGSFDCSSFISAILTIAGYFKTNPNFSTANEGSELEKAGFKKVASSASTSNGLQPGDVLITSGHTEIYLGNNQTAGARTNERHGIAGGQVGDQNSKEIVAGPYYNDHWTAVYRAQK